MKYNKKYILICVGILLTICFFFIISRIKTDSISLFDTAIYNCFTRNDLLTSIMKVITFMGEPVFLIVISILIFIFAKNRHTAGVVPLNLILIGCGNVLIKFIIKRPRPVGIRLIEIGGYSFPSGHSAMSLAFYGLLIYIVFKKIKNIKIKSLIIIFLSLLIFSIGLSRIYLGVHYASDVVGGFVFAAIYLMIYISLCVHNKVLES